MVKVLSWSRTALAELRLQILSICRIFRQHTKAIKAFTLAEVLVTLVIIGVIAALTIPSLIQNVQDQQYKTAWKESFSKLSAATQQIYASKQDIPFNGSYTLRDNYEQVMSFSSKDECANIFTSNYSYYNNPSLQGSLCAGSWPVPAVLLNGVYVGFGSESTYCNATTGSLSNICASFTVDVNGNKAPNMIGKDVFYAWLVKNNGGYAVYSAGSHGDGYTCVGDGTANYPKSAGCSTPVLMGQ